MSPTYCGLFENVSCVGMGDIFESEKAMDERRN